MDYGLLNMGSLLFGVIACILPFINLSQGKKSMDSKGEIFYIGSISSCGISLCMQIFYINHLVNVSDWSAMMDTLGVISFAAAFLLAMTIALNIITYALLNKAKG